MYISIYLQRDREREIEWEKDRKRVTERGRQKEGDIKRQIERKREKESYRHTEKQTEKNNVGKLKFCYYKKIYIQLIKINKKKWIKIYFLYKSFFYN